MQSLVRHARRSDPRASSADGGAEARTDSTGPYGSLFYVLDAYYLMLERRFRKSYNNFVGKLHIGPVTTSHLYTVVPDGSIARVMLWAMFRSFSVLPFYAAVVVTVLLAWRLIL